MELALDLSTILLFVVLAAQIGFAVVWILTRRGGGAQAAAESLTEEFRASARRTEETLEQELRNERSETARYARELREEVGKRIEDSGGKLGSQLNDRIEALRETNDQSAARLRTEVGERLKEFRTSLTEMSQTQEKRLEAVRTTLDAKVNELQSSNELKLDEMRKTVDEKLHGALEKRLGESFKQVSERLEVVHKGLGEMQTLANGVGDLKRLMSNVKTRGAWGEMQLGALLENYLAPDQFAANVEVRPGSGERVEFAIQLPDAWLPVDAKFPQEDYQRLLDAEDQSDAFAVETARRGLERAVRVAAKEIARKYINPPRTTDFAILFVPIESLYAELLRRPGLANALQQELRIVLAGPTTLSATLNSLQMGFRTLAIQQRSSEVWEVLGAVKAEFGKFGEVLDKVQKKLNEANNVMESAKQRSRVMQRKLKDVEALPEPRAGDLLGIEDQRGLFEGGDGESVKAAGVGPG